MKYILKSWIKKISVIYNKCIYIVKFDMKFTANWCEKMRNNEKRSLKLSYHNVSAREYNMINAYKQL